MLVVVEYPENNSGHATMSDDISSLFFLHRGSQTLENLTIMGDWSYFCAKWLFGHSTTGIATDCKMCGVVLIVL